MLEILATLVILVVSVLVGYFSIRLIAAVFGPVVSLAVIIALIILLATSGHSQAATFSRSYSPPARVYVPPRTMTPKSATTVTPRKAPVVVNKTVINKTTVNRTTVHQSPPRGSYSGSSGGGFWSSVMGSFTGTMIGQWVWQLFQPKEAPHAESQVQNPTE